MILQEFIFRNQEMPQAQTIELLRTSKLDFYFKWLEDDPVFKEIDHFLGVEHKQGVDWQIYDSRWPTTPHVTHLHIRTIELADEFAAKFNKPEAGYHENFEPSVFVNNDDSPAGEV